MRLLLLHLSDLHLASEGDALRSRPSAIAAAVRDMDPAVEHIVLAVTGDIAYSGQDEEYVLASEFFDQLSAALASSFGDFPIDLVSVPGNHDCDFSGPQGVRDLVLEGVRRDQLSAPAQDVISNCVQVQSSYESLAEDIVTLPKAEGSSRLMTSHILRDQGTPLVNFLCLNTAWLSQLEEKQGSLFFPPSLLPGRPTTPVVVALLHHPYSWLAADNSRLLRARLESIADLILTGHEHEADRRLLEPAHGGRVAFFEGGALQEAGSTERSSFNALVLDTQQRRQKFAQFIWEESRYVLGDLSFRGEDGRGLGWTPFFGRSRLSPELRADFRTSLEDPGAFFSQDHRQLSLQDVFVAPDLQRPPVSRTDSAQLVPSDEVLSFVSGATSQESRILISGDDQAGKTSLAKMVFLKALESGALPLLLTGRDSIPSGDKIYAFLERKFKDQFSSPDLETYRQSPRETRLVILDDYHLLRAPAAKRLELVNSLLAHAERVVLFANELSTAIEEIAQGATPLNFAEYRIQPFGFRRRQELAEKWLLNSSPQGEQPQELVRRLNSVERTLNSVVGRNFVPAYPIYLLAILQASEAAVPVDISAGTHGYYYELLIRSSLARSRGPRDFDVLLAALSWLAGELLKSGERKMPRERAQQVFGAYEEEADLSLDIDRLLAEFQTKRVLRDEGGLISFRYPYLFYYFAALYLRDRLDHGDVEAHVRKMASSLHEEENANVFLFLAHLSRHKLLLEVLLQAAKDICPELEEAQLKGDVAFLRDLPDLTRIAYEEVEPLDFRRELAAQRDGEDPGEVDLASPDAESPEEVARVSQRLEASLKTLQILGQVLKNFPGSLTAATKKEIASSCYSLGRRVLGWLLGLLESNRGILVESLVRSVRESHPSLDREQVANRAEATVLWLARVMTFGMVRRISMAVGATGLEKTYERALKESDQSPAAQLIDISIALDVAGGVPIGKIEQLGDELDRADLSHSILRLLVVHHFYLFPTGYEVKQRLCARLDIPYRQIKERARRPRLLQGS